MRPSQALYSALAPAYREHFEVAHRRAYDALAWKRVRCMLPERGPVIDAGCGVGRWVPRLLGLGYEVIGIEQAPGMIDQARRAGYGPGFTLIEGSMETAGLPDASAGLVLALGSLQYTADPAATLRRLAGWVRPGGTVVVLVDSLVALVIELLRDVEVVGLLSTAAPLGCERLNERLAQDWDGHLELERELSAHPVLADVGKQLLATGRKT